MRPFTSPFTSDSYPMPATATEDSPKTVPAITRDGDRSLDVSKSFGEAVRERRHEKGKTLRGVANDADLHFSYLSRIENGTLPHNPSEDVVRKIARVLDMNADLAMIRLGELPEWFEEYLTDNQRFTAHLMRAIQENPQDPTQFLQR